MKYVDYETHREVSSYLDSVRLELPERLKQFVHQRQPYGYAVKYDNRLAPWFPKLEELMAEHQLDLKSYLVGGSYADLVMVNGSLDVYIKVEDIKRLRTVTFNVLVTLVGGPAVAVGLLLEEN